jgi:hypothetical protein
LVPKKDLDRYIGFRSIYGFDELTATRIQLNQSTAGLQGTALFADTLFLDFDDNAQAANDIKLNLIQQKIQFELWESGGRSQHFHIPHTPVVHKNIPHRHKAWALDNAPGCDLSIYITSAIFRLPWTKHEKTKQPKKIIYRQGGDLIQLPQPKELPLDKPDILLYTQSQRGGLLLKLLNTPTQEGNRNNTAVRLVHLCLDCDYSHEGILTAMFKWNEDYCNPSIDMNQLQRIVRGVYANRRNRV